MCLDRVDKVYKGASRKVYKGYKIFRQLANSKGTVYLVPLHMANTYEGSLPNENTWNRWLNSASLPINQWMNEKSWRPSYITMDEICSILYSFIPKGQTYPIGWHVYMQPVELESYQSGDRSTYRGTVERQVQCKGLLAKGVEGAYDVWVFRWIKILG